MSPSNQAAVFSNIVLVAFCTVVGAIFGAALVGLAIGLGIVLFAQVA